MPPAPTAAELTKNQTLRGCESNDTIVTLVCSREKRNRELPVRCFPLFLQTANRLWLTVIVLSGFLLSAATRVSAQTGVFAAGGRHLYIRCEGKLQGPAVILDAGLFRDSTDWRLVQPEIARFDQVCAYDREGLGHSTVDQGVQPESECIDESVEDIRNLLQSVHIAPPYVLVGASGGGIRVRRYTRNHPDEVAGLVFVDSAHEEQLWRFLAIDPRSIQGPPADPNRAHCGGMLMSPGERLDWHTDKPLIVLEHGIPLTFDGPLAAHTAEFNTAVDDMAKDLAGRSPLGEFRIAHRSNHEIMLDEPAVVVQAIRDIWTAAQSPKRQYQ
jgi:pimeloyl-ACP methyl ester carboxylesterase